MAKDKGQPDDPALIDNDDKEVIIIDAEDDGQGGAADEGVESLREQLAAQTKRADEADRRAAERETEARRLAAENTTNRGELEDSRLQTIENAIAATEGKKKDLRARLIAAKSSGDYETEADINLEVAQVATELQRLNEGKSVLENRISDERERAKQPPVIADPLERAISGMPPRAAKWVRDHSEVIFDPVRNAELVLADKLAQRAGIDPASDAYFAHMDKHMGYSGSDDDAVERVPLRRSVAPAAPVSRGGSIDAPLAPGQVKLTKAERDMADEWGWSYDKYYKNKMLVQAESSTKN